MADEDLYDDFGMAGETPNAQAAAEQHCASAAPRSQATQKARSSEELPHAQSADVPQFKAAALDNAEQLDAEQAIRAIAEAIALNVAENAAPAPGMVAAAVAQLIQELQQCREQLHAEQKKQLAYQIQCANIATDLLESRECLTRAEMAAQPSVVHLKTLHTDPAVAKEFAMLRDDNMRLQQDNVKMRAEVNAPNFVKATGPEGKNMLAQLNAAIEKQQACEWQLQQQDTTLAQLALTRRQLSEVTAAHNRMHAQNVALCAQAEDLAVQAATLRKSGGDVAAFETQAAYSGRGPARGGGELREGGRGFRGGGRHQGRAPPMGYAPPGPGSSAGGGRWSGYDDGDTRMAARDDSGPGGFLGKRPGYRGPSDRGGGRGQWM